MDNQNANKGNGPGPYELLRLDDNFDIGIHTVGIVAKIVDEMVLAPPGEMKPTGKKVVELWVTISLMQPSALAGQLYHEQILWKKIDNIPALELINQFAAARAAKGTGLVVAP